MVDLRESPPRGVFMVVDADGRIAARRVWYREGLQDGATVPRLAAAAFADGAEHELLPASEALETCGLWLQRRSEPRRLGKECARTCSARWSLYHHNKKHNKTNIEDE